MYQQFDVDIVPLGCNFIRNETPAQGFFQPAFLLENETPVQVFPGEFFKIFQPVSLLRRDSSTGIFL